MLVDPTPLGYKNDNPSLLPLLNDVLYPPAPPPILSQGQIEALPKEAFAIAKLEPGTVQDGVRTALSLLAFLKISNQLGAVRRRSKGRCQRSRRKAKGTLNDSKTHFPSSSLANHYRVLNFPSQNRENERHAQRQPISFPLLILLSRDTAKDAPPHLVHPSYLFLHLLVVSLQVPIHPVGGLLLRVKAEAEVEVVFKVSILLLDTVKLRVLVQAQVVDHSRRVRNNVQRVWKSKEVRVEGKDCLVGRQVQCPCRQVRHLEIAMVGEVREAGHWHRPRRRSRVQYRGRDSSPRIGIKGRVARMCSRYRRRNQREGVGQQVLCPARV